MDRENLWQLIELVVTGGGAGASQSQVGVRLPHQPKRPLQALTLKNCCEHDASPSISLSRNPIVTAALCLRKLPLYSNMQ